MMADLSRLLELLMRAPGLVPDVISAIDAKVPSEVRDEWEELKAPALAAADPVRAATVIAGGLLGALSMIKAGHGEVGPSHAHLA